jgi:hypothetical protein
MNEDLLQINSAKLIKRNHRRRLLLLLVSKFNFCSLPAQPHPSAQIDFVNSFAASRTKEKNGERNFPPKSDCKLMFHL